MKVAIALNEAGMAHVAERLADLGLDWSVDGTADVIAGKDGFMSLQPGQAYEYEISHMQAGKPSYGILGYIEIDADRHVFFEDLDE